VRFQLIDRVLEQDETSLRAVKNVTSAEEYLADHFPGFPVLPGVMMLEAMIQAGRLLLAGRTDQPMIATEVRNIRYGHFVRPGETLTLDVHLRKETPGGWEFSGSANVAGEPAVQGRFRLNPLTP